MIEEVLVEAPVIPVPVDLQRMEMNFNPRFVELAGLDLKMGSSDLHLTGELTNFIPYVFEGATVSGALEVTSGLLDANELMPESELEAADDTTAVAGEELAADGA